MSGRLKEFSLEELLIHYKSSDAEAFREFYDRTHKTVYQFLRVRSRSRYITDEVFQDTYFRIHKYISTYDPARKAISWILTIAKNCLIDRFQQSQSLAQEDCHFDEAYKGLDNKCLVDAEDTLIFNELLQKLDQKLSSDEVSLLIARFFDDSSYKEISQNHGVSEANIRKRVSRLVKKIREILLVEQT